ncbi:MAG: FHA domain-containing protein [Fischerella sp.]|jgi:pSer/pThr/pTyr-binding forkhead associated (FHA) protein|uniref:FHA domain-containing protein n=1 Tax=Fischerella sp. TaxID=1191 RepID=UPI0017B847BA|nr:FHA domain-containing protein [Fischerella sp.]NWF62355.1 FHA domain-containing protein [Fischerella sp.]
MQNLGTSQATELSLELFHVQTNTSFEMPPNFPIIYIGKPNEKINPDVDVSGLPDADIVSRLHAKIQVEGNTYYIEDLGSSNGTYLNNTKLEPRTRYPLNLGDRIDFGQGGKVTFIFQNRQENPVNRISISDQTVFPPQRTGTKTIYQTDRTSKVVGSALMVAGILILAASTQVGIFIRLPGVLLSIAGVAVLLIPRINRTIGWLLILAGIAVIVFTGGLFASVNLLSVLVASVLLAAGYLLFSTGRIWKYDLQTLQGLVNKQRRN